MRENEWLRERYEQKLTKAPQTKTSKCYPKSDHVRCYKYQRSRLQMWRSLFKKFI